MAENEKRKMTEKGKRYFQQKDKRAGDEKEKRKNNPFSEPLRSDEEVLWLSSSYAKRSTEERIDGFIIHILVAVALFLVLWLLSPLLQEIHVPTQFQNLWSRVTSMSPYLTSGVVMLLGVSKLFRRSRLEHMYAVTNQRLLYEIPGHGFISIDLDDVLSLNVVPEANKRYTLDFGKSPSNSLREKEKDDDLLPIRLPFPPWHNLMDAEAVKAIIDEAQAQQMWRNLN